MDCCTLAGVKPEISMCLVSSALYTGGTGRLGKGGDTEETLSKSIRLPVVGVCESADDPADLLDRNSSVKDGLEEVGDASFNSMRSFFALTSIL